MRSMVLRGTVCRYQLRQQHLAAALLHQVGSDHVSTRVVGAFDQHVRRQRVDQFERRVLAENDYRVDDFSDASTVARATSPCTGRSGPFNRRTDRSEFRPTTRRSADCRA